MAFDEHGLAVCRHHCPSKQQCVPCSNRWKARHRAAPTRLAAMPQPTPLPRCSSRLVARRRRRPQSPPPLAPQMLRRCPTPGRRRLPAPRLLAPLLLVRRVHDFAVLCVALLQGKTSSHLPASRATGLPNVLFENLHVILHAIRVTLLTSPMSGMGGTPDVSQMMGGMGGAGGVGGMGAGAAPDMNAMAQMMENPQMQEQMAAMMAMPGVMVSCCATCTCGWQSQWTCSSVGPVLQQLTRCPMFDTSRFCPAGCHDQFQPPDAGSGTSQPRAAAGAMLQHTLSAHGMHVCKSAL